MTFSKLACPLDQLALQKEGNSLKCEKGHSYDISKKGYINLLPVQQKRSRDPGDSKEMVLARSRFLNQDYYRAIAEKLCKLVVAEAEDATELSIIDAGCGEGYYLDLLYKFLQTEKIKNVNALGIDISKHAIAEAAKRNKNISWVVGTNRKLPVLSKSVDMIICMFGFPSFEVFSSALKPGGKLITVDPGPEHLIELRKIIYDELRKPGGEKPLNTLAQLSREEKLAFSIENLNNEDINDLLLMTPHFFRADKNKKELARNLQTLSVSVQLDFNVYKL